MPQRKKRAPQRKKKVSTKHFKSIRGFRNSYSIEKKQEVVNYAVKNGRNEAARHFELDSSMVGRWMKANEKWLEKNQNTKKIGSGRKEFFPEAEKKLYDWIIIQRKRGLGVSYTSARIKMSEILREPEMINLYDNSVDFKLSSRWMFGFMKRYKLSRRRRTKISQKLPTQTNELLNNFQQYIIRLRTEKSYEMANILNMDETPVWFDMAGNFTIDQTGEKTIQICGTGNEKNRFTVVLTCAAGKYIFRGGY